MTLPTLPQYFFIFKYLGNIILALIPKKLPCHHLHRSPVIPLFQIPLHNRPKPYSRQRTSMIIKLLNDYNISEFDTDRISLLINQTKEAQIAHNPFSPIIDPIIKLIKGVSPIIISIISYIPQKTTSDRDLQFTIIELSILFCAILGIYIMFAVFSPILKDLIYRDYSKYNSLIYDLNQIKIFQPNQTTNFSNHFSSYKSK